MPNIPEHLLPKEPYCGQCDPLFLYPDNLRHCDILRERRANTALSDSERHRLVKAPKSPTEDELLESAYQRHSFFFNALKHKHCEPSPECAVIEQHEFQRTRTPINSTGCKGVVEYREWQEAWRVRTQVETISGTLPPEQNGQRESMMLTGRGATKIAESCEYMHLKHGGFKTFVTGTFSSDARQRITSGETTIQKEVTRTMDALQKMYQRGWTTKTGERVPGTETGLPYLWVVEVPENDQGEPNPHIHMLLGWRVDYRHFAEWAERIEHIWGNGYFHLEKIKDSACAGAYMAKAAGYLCKAQDKDDQGTVTGNRYGISKTARAPAWVVIEYAQLDVLGQLIYDVYDHLTVKHGDDYRERKALNTKLSNTPKNHKGLRKKIGEKLAKVRQKLNALPIRANKYQVVVKGKGHAFAFFNWLITPTEAGSVREDWLPVKPEGIAWQQGPLPKAKHNQFFTHLYRKFERSRFWRRLSVIPQWITDASSNEFWHANKWDYQTEQDYEPDPHQPTYEQMVECGFI